MATKFETKLAITRLVYEISRRSLPPNTGVFGVGLLNDVTQILLTTDPGCHGDEASNKNGYNSACASDFSDIFASNRGFLCQAIKRCQSNFTTTDPGCHGKFVTK